MHTQTAKSVSGCMRLGAERAGSLITQKYDPELPNGAGSSRLMRSITKKRGVTPISPPPLGSQT